MSRSVNNKYKLTKEFQSRVKERMDDLEHTVYMLPEKEEPADQAHLSNLNPDSAAQSNQEPRAMSAGTMQNPLSVTAGGSIRGSRLNTNPSQLSQDSRMGSKPPEVEEEKEPVEVQPQVI